MQHEFRRLQSTNSTLVGNSSSASIPTFIHQSWVNISTNRTHKAEVLLTATPNESRERLLDGLNDSALESMYSADVEEELIATLVAKVELVFVASHYNGERAMFAAASAQVYQPNPLSC